MKDVSRGSHKTQDREPRMDIPGSESYIDVGRRPQRRPRHDAESQRRGRLVFDRHAQVQPCMFAQRPTGRGRVDVF